MPNRSRPKGPIRFAVVGLGWFAQSAILPAFKAQKHAELRALVSGDAEKLRKLGKRYKVEHSASYEEYEALLASGEIDAVYIALPNSMHADFTIRAANAGVHVLCEKPMATSEAEGMQMIAAANEAGVRLMIAYRLHLEAANLAAIELAQSGKLGELRFYDAAFSMPVELGNTRLDAYLGGGPLNDIGIYCINAARYLFRDEPSEVFAVATRRHGDERFAQVPEQVSAIMRFPHQRVATFTCSFGGADIGRYDLVGDNGRLRLEPAFSHSTDLVLEARIGKRSTKKTFKHRDQVAAEIAHFAERVLAGKDPEPSGLEGLEDIRIIAALNESIASGKLVKLTPLRPPERPSSEHERKVAAKREPDLINADAPRAS